MAIDTGKPWSHCRISLFFKASCLISPPSVYLVVDYFWWCVVSPILGGKKWLEYVHRGFQYVLVVCGVIHCVDCLNCMFLVFNAYSSTTEHLHLIWAWFLWDWSVSTPMADYSIGLVLGIVLWLRLMLCVDFGVGLEHDYDIEEV